MPSAADAIRTYIATLRHGRGMSQDAVADAIGMAIRTYVAWETGETKDIKTPFVVKAIRVLRGAIIDLDTLVDATPDEAADLARKRLSSSERDLIEPFLAPDESVARLLRVIYEMSDDPELRGRIQGYIDGLRSVR